MIREIDIYKYILKNILKLLMNENDEKNME